MADLADNQIDLWLGILSSNIDLHVPDHFHVYIMNRHKVVDKNRIFTKFEKTGSENSTAVPGEKIKKIFKSGIIIIIRKN